MSSANSIVDRPIQRTHHFNPNNLFECKILVIKQTPPLPGESWLWTYTMKTLSEQEMKSPSTNREEGRRGLE